MLNISVDLQAGLAKLAQATTVKAGGGIPVVVTFSNNPGLNPAIELSLGPQSSAQTVVAYLDVFATESQTVYTGTLDGTDNRLIGLLAGKQALTLSCEITYTVTGALPRRFPNFNVTVQPPMVTGPETSEGGPVYLTTGTGDARYLQTANNLGEISTAGSASRSSARSNIGLLSMLLREELAGPVTFNTVGQIGQYWFDSENARLWVYAGGQFRYTTLISEA